MNDRGVRVAKWEDRLWHLMYTEPESSAPLLSCVSLGKLLNFFSCSLPGSKIIDCLYLCRGAL